MNNQATTMLNAEYRGYRSMNRRALFSVDAKYGYRFYEVSESLKIDDLEIGRTYSIVVEDRIVISVVA